MVSLKCAHLSPVFQPSSLSTVPAGVLPLPTLPCPYNSLKGCPGLEVYSRVQYDLSKQSWVLPPASNNPSKKSLEPAHVLLPAWTQEQGTCNHLVLLPRCPPLSSSTPRPDVLSNLPSRDLCKGKSLPVRGYLSLGLTNFNGLFPVSSGLVTTETSETPISLSSCYPDCRPFAGALALSDKDGMSPMHLIKPAQAGSPIPHCPQSDSYQLPSSLPCFSSGLLQILLLHGVWKRAKYHPQLTLGHGVLSWHCSCN